MTPKKKASKDKGKWEVSTAQEARYQAIMKNKKKGKK